MEQNLTLREALVEDRLDDFVRQEEDRGVELANGSDLERALALLITQRRLEARSACSASPKPTQAPNLAKRAGCRLPWF